MRAFPLALALLLTGCAVTPRVHTDFDRAANFAAYRTYNWIPVEVPTGMNPIEFRRVQGSIDRSLAARGFTQGNPGDFAIGFTIGERDRTEVNDWGGSGWGNWGWGGAGWGGWGHGWGWGGWPDGWSYPYRSIDVYTVTDRSIIIDVYDEKTKTPVWHGVVTRSGYPDDEFDTRKLDGSVDAVLNRFPPPVQRSQ